MKKSIVLAVALWVPVAAVGIVPIPHPNQTRKQFTAGKTVGTAFGAIGALAELNALGAESQLKKVERNLVRLNKLYKRSQGTKKEMSAKRYERNKKKYMRQRERLLKDLRNSERTAHVGLMGQELAAVRNNWAERPLGAVAEGLAWNVPHTPQTLGRFLPLRTLLALLDGVLSITRHFWYQSPQHLAWLTAAQRTSRLMKMVLRNGFKGVPKRVLVSYALQLIGVGMSFMGDVRHNALPGMRNGVPVDEQGESLIGPNGQPRDANEYERWYDLNANRILNDPTAPMIVLRSPTGIEFFDDYGDLSQEGRDALRAAPDIAGKRAVIAQMRRAAGRLPNATNPQIWRRQRANQMTDDASDHIEANYLRSRSCVDVCADIARHVTEQEKPECPICLEKYKQGECVSAFRCGHPLGHTDCTSRMHSCPACRATGDKVQMQVTSAMVASAASEVREESRLTIAQKQLARGEVKKCLGCDNNFSLNGGVRVFPCGHIVHNFNPATHCKNQTSDAPCPVTGCGQRDEDAQDIVRFNVLSPYVMRQFWLGEDEPATDDVVSDDEHDTDDPRALRAAADGRSRFHVEPNVVFWWNR